MRYAILGVSRIAYICRLELFRNFKELLIQAPRVECPTRVIFL